MARFAIDTEAIAWLILRSGNEYVCAVRKGDLVLRGFMVHVGTRRPLFTSVGGVAIMQTLPSLEADNILLDNIQHEESQRGSVRLGALKKMRDRSQRHGFGVNLGEIWHLTPLANWLREHTRSRFLLTAPPLRLPGAVGSPATPVATV